MVTELSDKELLEDLRRSPRGQQIVAERQEARLAARRSLAEELGEVLSGLEANAPKLVQADAKFAEQVRKAEERLQALRLSSGASEERQIRNRLDHRKSLLESQLAQTAPAVIDAFIDALYREEERVRNQGVSIDPPRRNVLGKMVGGGSNLKSVTARTQGIRAARIAAEALKLQALTEEELGKRLDALRAAIPEVGPIVEGE